MTIQEALTQCRIDFVESGHHHSRPGWLQIARCPFCGSDKYHLGFNIAHSYSSCWKCGHHSAWSLYVALEFPRHIARELFRSRKDYELQEFRDARTRTKLVEPNGRGPLKATHRNYLKGRGLDPDEIAKLWQVEGIGIAARLSWRLYIPILLHGKKVSWTTRAVGTEVEQRYVSASAEEEAVNHKEVVYGLDYVRGSALIVEGPTDVWNIGPGAVGLFGLAYSTAQVRALSLIPRRFVCFDNSKDAQQRARALASDLACFPGTTQIVELDAEDPGSASKEEVDSVRKCLGF